MKGVLEREKMHPNGAMTAGWSPVLQMYVMTTLESDSFFSYCDFYEITEETYVRFCDDGFRPTAERLLFSQSPHHKVTAEEKAMRDKFFEIS
ncbi:MAG: hypothetical protein K2G32_08130 [Oscillospiraceae bacterium]|nr:hypothetical protein [Oscillospiraceae bacterium]